MPFTTTPLAGGDEGTRQTVQRMIDMTRDARANPIVRNQAVSLARGVLPRDTVGQIRAIRDFLREHVHFLADQIDVEWLHRPADLLVDIERRYYVMADCDDVAMLGASLGGAIGLPARFVIIGFFRENAPMSHVYTELFDGQVWRELDTTRTISETERRRLVSREWFVPT